MLYRVCVPSASACDWKVLLSTRPTHQSHSSACGAICMRVHIWISFLWFSPQRTFHFIKCSMWPGSWDSHEINYEMPAAIEVTLATQRASARAVESSRSRRWKWPWCLACQRLLMWRRPSIAFGFSDVRSRKLWIGHAAVARLCGKQTHLSCKHFPF